MLLSPLFLLVTCRVASICRSSFSTTADKKEKEQPNNKQEERVSAERLRMKLEAVIHRVETRLLNLGKTLLQAGEKADLQEDLELAQAELTGRKVELTQTEARRDELRARIQARKETAALLPEQIENSFCRGKRSQALRQALELEHLRRDLASDEAQLPKVEQTIWSLNFQIRQMERRLTCLREEVAGR
jgi:hypothetical protein